jgi:hypothetical protein
LWVIVIGLLLNSGLGRLQAQILTADISSSYYGYLDQYSLNAEHDYVGNEACVPTSSVNMMTMLQNLYPSTFGTSLTGSSYVNWHDTDNTLISLYGTTAGSNGGTADPQFVNGLYNYMVTTNGFTQTTFAGEFPSDDGWSTQYPAPSYISFTTPKADFIYNALSLSQGLLLGIDYSDSSGNLTSGGHELLVNGINWDPSTNSGTISFIDPLDPSASSADRADSYISGSSATPATSYDQSIGPAVATTGTITLLSDGHLLLTYDQYDGSGVKVPTPGVGTYDEVDARIDTVLSVGVEAVPEPTTTAMFVCGLGFMLFWLRRSSRKQPQNSRF